MEKKYIKFENKKLRAKKYQAVCGKIISLYNIKTNKNEYCLNITEEQTEVKNKKNCFWLKDYTENTKIAPFLITNFYLEPTGRYYKKNEFVVIYETKMTKKFIQILNKNNE